MLIALSFNLSNAQEAKKSLVNPTVGLTVSNNLDSQFKAVPQVTLGLDLLDEVITASARLGGHIDLNTANNEYALSDTFAGLNIAMNFPNKFITPYIFAGASTYFETAYDVTPNFGAGLKKNLSTLTLSAQYELMFDEQYASVGLAVRL